jgi:8-oxo-dGTP pyrophosphatase MutT (NUDIX family)
MPDAAKQIAALPVRRKKNGKIEILLVTSRDTGRWVLPKGWLIKGKSPWRAAAIEALEEAGAKGRVAKPEIGTFTYDKRLDDGAEVPCEVSVYPMLVERLKTDWKERAERRRRWFSPRRAAEAVKEPGLEALLRQIDEAPRKSRALMRLIRKT